MSLAYMYQGLEREADTLAPKFQRMLQSFPLFFIHLSSWILPF